MALVFISLAFASCEKDSHDPDFELSGDVQKYFPDYCVKLSASYNYGGNKQFHMTAEPYFYFSPEEWDISIDKVDYYVDDEYIQTETVSPYSIEYYSDDWYTGAHNVRADITISGKNIDTFVLQTKRVIDNSSSQERAADIWFDYDYATTGQDFFISGNLNPSRSAVGTTVNSFSAKWDDISMGEKTNSPYKVTRVITEAAGTTHAVSATLNYTQGNIRMSYGFSMSTYEIPGPTTVRQMFRIKSRYNDFKNGETLEGIARLYVGSDVKSTYEFELYLDNNLIGSSKTFPYDLSYRLQNLEIGDHTLRETWVCYDEEGNRKSSFSTDEILTITE